MIKFILFSNARRWTWPTTIGGIYFMTSVGKAITCVTEKYALRNFTNFDTNWGYSKYCLWTLIFWNIGTNNWMSFSNSIFLESFELEGGQLQSMKCIYGGFFCCFCFVLFFWVIWGNVISANIWFKCFL